MNFFLVGYTAVSLQGVLMKIFGIFPVMSWWQAVLPLIVQGTVVLLYYILHIFVTLMGYRREL